MKKKQKDIPEIPQVIPLAILEDISYLVAAAIHNSQGDVLKAREQLRGQVTMQREDVVIQEFALLWGSRLQEAVNNVVDMLILDSIGSEFGVGMPRVGGAVKMAPPQCLTNLRLIEEDGPRG